MKLNLGCGQVRPAGWWNGDSSLNSLMQKYGIQTRKTKYAAPANFINLNRRWPFKSGSVQTVYGSHVFEHLDEYNASHFLKEASRVLAPGGHIRLVVPSMIDIARNYIAEYDRGEDGAAASFLYAMNLHQSGTYTRPSLNLDYMVGLIQGFPHQHKYMYDPNSLKLRLQSAGFVDIRFSAYGISDYLSDIADVECTKEGIPSIYIEGRR